METYKLKSGKTLQVIQDTDASNPRTEWDNFGTMVCFHKRYSLGDKHDINSDNFDSLDEIKQHLTKQKAAVVILPVYMYDHSGITIATTPFSCPWDSGQLGFIYVSRETLRIEYSCKNITKTIREKAEKVLQAEIELYNQYLTGDVWGFKVIDNEGNDEDSCWGFYGSDPKENGMLDNIDDELV